MKEDKISYERPVTTVVEMKQEGVICSSGDITCTIDGTWDEETI